jgi:hypothetical protein
VTGKSACETPLQALVDEDAHCSDGFENAALAGFDDGNHLLALDAGETFQKIINGLAAFQIIDQILERNARPDKHGRAAHDVRVRVHDTFEVIQLHALTLTAGGTIGKHPHPALTRPIRWRSGFRGDGVHQRTTAIFRGHARLQGGTLLVRMSTRMAEDKRLIPAGDIERLIYLIRGQKVMLDFDLAEIYGVTTARLNQQVRRNRERFPRDFAFQLTKAEFETLMLQIATSKKGRGGRRKLPWAFTEHGAIMLASVLNSPVAVQASVQVVRAFVRLRELLASNRELAQKLAELEHKLEGHDAAIHNLFEAIRRLLAPSEPRHRQIGFQVKENNVRYLVVRKRVLTAR